MMTIQNDILRHQVFLERVSFAFRNDYLRYVNRIVNQLKRMPKNNIPIQLMNVEGKIDEWLGKAYSKSKNNFVALSKQEGDFTTKLLNKHMVENAVNASVETLENVSDVPVQTTFWKQSKTLDDSLLSFNKKIKKDYIQIVRDGEIEGQVAEDINNRLEQTKNGMTTTQATVLFGLGALAVSAYAQQQTYRENEIARLKWLSVLEDNTCPHCEGLHGETFEIDNVPSFPSHGRCQCSLLPKND